MEEAACEFFAKRLQVSNAMSALSFAETLSAGAQGSVLRQKCVESVMAHFEECSRQNGFIRMRVETVAEMIASDELEASEEELVLDAVLRWAEGNSGQTEEALLRLLPLVRFSLMASPPVEKLKKAGVLHDSRSVASLVMSLLCELHPGYKVPETGPDTIRFRMRHRQQQQIKQEERERERKLCKFTRSSSADVNFLENGAVSQIPDGVARGVWRSAVTEAIVCQADGGQHYAEFTLVGFKVGIVVSVARLGHGAWGYAAATGRLVHAGTRYTWTGETPCCEGDTIGLLVDFSRGGSLAVYKNGVYLGTMVERGLGGELCFMAEMLGEGDTVRIAKKPPPPQSTRTLGRSSSASGGAAANAPPASSPREGGAAAGPGSQRCAFSIGCHRIFIGFSVTDSELWLLSGLELAVRI